MKNIILFSGSFDPIHNGHISIINFVKEKIKDSSFYIIPTKKHRWKKSFESIYHRLKMIKLALEDDKTTHISYYEIKKKNNKPNYTIDTINHFLNIFPDKKIYFLIGSDILNEFKKWEKYNEIIKKVNLICIERPGYNINSNESILNLTNPIVYKKNIEISSSMIRNLQKIDVPKKVLAYITNNKLYFIKKIKKYYSKKRFKHALSVALLAYEIAEKNKIEDCYKCYIAGLLHDITKKISFKNQKIIINKIKKEEESEKNTNTSNIDRNLYHQITAKYIAKKNFKITDEYILEAIRFHTTGKENFSPIGKILFIADKLDPLRNIKDSEKYIKESFKNYDNIYEIIRKKISAARY